MHPYMAKLLRTLGDYKTTTHICAWDTHVLLGHTYVSGTHRCVSGTRIYVPECL